MNYWSKIKSLNSLIYIPIAIGILIGISLTGCGKISPLFNDHKSELHFKRGQKHHKKGKLDLALIEFNKADSISPNTLTIYSIRGVLLAQMGKYEAALQDYNRAVESDVDGGIKEMLYFGRARVLMNLGRKEESCQDLMSSGEHGKEYLEKYCN